MNPFTNLPNELIVKICNKLDQKSLMNVTKSSSQIYQVCSSILKKRKFNQFMTEMDSNQSLFVSNEDIPGLTVLVNIQIKGQNYNVEQIIIPYDGVVQPISSREPDSEIVQRGLIGDTIRIKTYIFNINNEPTLTEIIENLVLQGYQLS